jgi:hypothetical protein
MSGKVGTLYTSPLKAILTNKFTRFTSKWSIMNIMNVINKVRREKRTDIALLSSPQGG